MEATLEPPMANLRDTAVLDHASLELASMVRPDIGEPASPQEIWDRVVGDNVTLPGNWDTTIRGALRAARQGDWAACVYLAATHFRSQGNPEALAAVDESSHNFLWLSAVEPIVIEVPKGRERIWVQWPDADGPEWVPTDRIVGAAVSKGGRVQVKGRGYGELALGPHRSAERLRAGEVVELSRLLWPERRLRRLVLHQDDILELRRFLPDSVETLKEVDAPAFLRNDGLRAHVPGGRFHVLAYPLAGDLTKALLRPVKASITDSQVLRGLGETLLSQCAKSGHWSLFQLLLTAGVPCPDLAEEFMSVCGNLPAVRRQWYKDVLSASGGGCSLLQLALDAEGDMPLKVVLESLQAAGRPPNLDLSSAGQTPTLVSVAESGRWDLLKVLLEESPDGNGLCYVASVASLVGSAGAQAMAKAPAEVIELVQTQAFNEKLNGVRARSLKEFFARQLCGELMDTVVPSGFTLEAGVLNGPKELRVLAQGVRLGNGAGAEVTFVSLSCDEWQSAIEAIEDGSQTMLPIDLSGKVATLQDPRGGGLWLGVSCPEGYLRKGLDNELTVRVPGSCFPAPYIPQSTVCVSVMTPCCKKPVKGALVYIDGTRAGLTDDDGELRLAIPPGKHMIAVPKLSHEEQAVEVGRRNADAVKVIFETSGGLFVYLQDMSLDDEFRDGVMLCGNPFQVPSEAKSFAGSVSMGRLSSSSSRRGGSTLAPGALASMINVTRDTSCGELIRTFVARPALYDGAHYEPSSDFLEWVEDLRSNDECVLAILCSMPQRLGTMVHIGSPSTRQPPQSRSLFAVQDTVARGSSKTLLMANIRGDHTSNAAYATFGSENFSLGAQQDFHHAATLRPRQPSARNARPASAPGRRRSRALSLRSGSARLGRSFDMRGRLFDPHSLDLVHAR